MAPHVGRRILALRYIRDTIFTPTAIGLVTWHLATRFHLPYKPLLIACCIFIGWPIKFSLRVRYESWRRARNARALGSVPPLESRGKLFGDIDIAQEIQEASKNGFIGKRVSQSCFNMLIEHNFL